MPTEPSIEFINHASVLLSDGRVGLLTDPWYSGQVFHQGWSLLHENSPEQIRALLARTHYIWLSHEHPDHFSPPFFKQFREEIKAAGIRILFQRTHDQRVRNFLAGLEFEVIEMNDGEPLRLSADFTIRSIQWDLYDSALLAQIQGVSVFNLNDCAITNPAALARLSARYGHCDVLLTQFSYAAWKGGKAMPERRQQAARSKLAAMRRQALALQASRIIPFASFTRFSNTLNAYLNDAINTPEQVRAALADLPARCVFLQPGEQQSLSALQQAPASLAFWQACHAGLGTAPLSQYASLPLARLAESFQCWQARIRRNNSPWLMKLAQHCIRPQPFAPLTLQLLDQNCRIRLGPLGDFRILPQPGEADIALHSASLDFLFQHDFGFDTLYVNGCFEVLKEGGFGRFMRCFGIGSLNAIGLHISPRVIFRLNTLRRILRKEKTLTPPRAKT